MEHYFTNSTNLKSELRTIDYTYGSFSLLFYSDNGVFSKDKVDFGSRFLIETFLKHNQKLNPKVLDVGCGYGFIGITLAKVLNSQVTMVDVNKRAIHLTQMNIKENKVNALAFESNMYDNVKEKYDVVITNPPIRAGKDIVLGILHQAKDFLVDDGELWFVIRKEQGAKSTIKYVNEIYTCEIIDKTKGFFVIKAKKSLTR